MMTWFRVQGFRQFTDLAVDGLGRLNLIVGENGAGKSSLLEALWLYINLPRLDVIDDLIRMRGEIVRRGMYLEAVDELWRSPYSTIATWPPSGKTSKILLSSQ